MIGLSIKQSLIKLEGTVNPEKIGKFSYDSCLSTIRASAIFFTFYFVYV